jgi:hypothetical protein
MAQFLLRPQATQFLPGRENIRNNFINGIESAKPLKTQYDRD